MINGNSVAEKAATTPSEGHDQPPPSYNDSIGMQATAPPLISTNVPTQAIYSPTSVVHPIPSSPPLIIMTSSTGMNPCGDQVQVNINTYVVKKSLTAEPYEEYCPNCKCRRLTVQRYVAGKLTWVLVIVILVVFCPLAFLPFLVDSCKDVEHRCSKCGLLLGIKPRFSC